MNGPDTDALGTSKTAVEAVAYLTVAATLLSMAPHTTIMNPAEHAIHTVNEAMKRGNLFRVHKALTEHLR